MVTRYDVTMLEHSKHLYYVSMLYVMLGKHHLHQDPTTKMSERSLVSKQPENTVKDGSRGSHGLRT